MARRWWPAVTWLKLPEMKDITAKQKNYTSGQKHICLIHPQDVNTKKPHIVPLSSNLNKNSLEQILNSDYLDSVFADRWESASKDEEKMGYCFNTCSVDHMKDLFVKKEGFPIKPIL